jgi:hypothetical protein
MKLYRVLQQEVGAVNALVVGLHNETITAEEAKTKAKEELEKALAAINEE